MGHRATGHSATCTARAVSVLMTALVLVLALAACGNEPPDREALEDSVARVVNSETVRDEALGLGDDAPPFVVECPTIEPERAVCKFGPTHDPKTGQPLPSSVRVPTDLSLDGKRWVMVSLNGERLEDFLDEYGDPDNAELLSGEVGEQDG